MRPSPDFIAQRLQALYRQDADERITAINQWDGGETPRFHLMRTANGNGWRFRAGLDLALIEAIDALSQAEPALGSVTDPGVMREGPALTAPAVTLLRASAPVEAIWRGPVYTFPDSLAAGGSLNPGGSVDVVNINAENSHTLRPGMADWLPDVAHRAPFMAALVDGQAVAVCASVRIGTSLHEAGVETRPEYRGRGFAGAVVRAWAAAVRRLGALPVYSTSWENLPSQALARSLGCSLIGTDFHIR